MIIKYLFSYYINVTELSLKALLKDIYLRYLNFISKKEKYVDFRNPQQ